MSLFRSSYFAKTGPPKPSNPTNRSKRRQTQGGRGNKRTKTNTLVELLNKMKLILTNHPDDWENIINEREDEFIAEFGMEKYIRAKKRMKTEYQNKQNESNQNSITVEKFLQAEREHFRRPIDLNALRDVLINMFHEHADGDHGFSEIMTVETIQIMLAGFSYRFRTAIHASRFIIPYLMKRDGKQYDETRVDNFIDSCMQIPFERKWGIDVDGTHWKPDDNEFIDRVKYMFLNEENRHFLNETIRQCREKLRENTPFHDFVKENPEYSDFIDSVFAEAGSRFATTGAGFNELSRCVIGNKLFRKFLIIAYFIACIIASFSSIERVETVHNNRNNMHLLCDAIESLHLGESQKLLLHPDTSQDEFKRINNISSYAPRDIEGLINEFGVPNDPNLDENNPFELWNKMVKYIHNNVGPLRDAFVLNNEGIKNNQENLSRSMRLAIRQVTMLMGGDALSRIFNILRLMGYTSTLPGTTRGRATVLGTYVGGPIVLVGLLTQSLKALQIYDDFLVQALLIRDFNDIRPYINALSQNDFSIFESFGLVAQNTSLSDLRIISMAVEFCIIHMMDSLIGRLPSGNFYAVGENFHVVKTNNTWYKTEWNDDEIIGQNELIEEENARYLSQYAKPFAKCKVIQYDGRKYMIIGEHNAPGETESSAAGETKSSAAGETKSSAAGETKYLLLDINTQTTREINIGILPNHLQTIFYSVLGTTSMLEIFRSIISNASVNGSLDIARFILDIILIIGLSNMTKEASNYNLTNVHAFERLTVGIWDLATGKIYDDMREELGYEQLSEYYKQLSEYITDEAEKKKYTDALAFYNKYKSSVEQYKSTMSFDFNENNPDIQQTIRTYRDVVTYLSDTAEEINPVPRISEDENTILFNRAEYQKHAKYNVYTRKIAAAAINATPLPQPVTGEAKEHGTRKRTKSKQRRKNKTKHLGSKSK